MLNRFCEDIGVTRNENLIEYDRLQEIFRQVCVRDKNVKIIKNVYIFGPNLLFYNVLFLI